MEKKWYAIYTWPRWEKKVAETLTKSSYENYCPLNKVVKQWSDRKKVIEEPLFTSYVFVRTTQKQISALKAISGVVSVVHWLGKPAVIRDSEIELIKDFLRNRYNVKLERAAVTVEDRIKIISGPFVELEGKVVSVSKRAVKVLLPSFGCMMVAEVEHDDIAIIRKHSAEITRKAG